MHDIKVSQCVVSPITVVTENSLDTSLKEKLANLEHVYAEQNRYYPQWQVTVASTRELINNFDETPKPYEQKKSIFKNLLNAFLSIF